MAPAPAKSSALSAIDAIFASKKSTALNSKGKDAVDPIAEAIKQDAKGKGKAKASNADAKAPDTSSDNRPSKRSRTAAPSAGSVPKAASSRPAVEEIIDPSSAALVTAQAIPASLASADSGGGSGKGKRKLALDEEELKFRDSRGSRSKTEDGMPIYSVEELKIGLGGDTPLCPFDCTCCY